jgi:hypothetical protein
MSWNKRNNPNNMHGATLKIVAKLRKFSGCRTVKQFCSSMKWNLLVPCSTVTYSDKVINMPKARLLAIYKLRLAGGMDIEHTSSSTS